MPGFRDDGVPLPGKLHVPRFFRQLCLALGIKLMEINSNLSSKYCELVFRVTRVTMHQPSKDPMSRAKFRHPIHTVHEAPVIYVQGFQHLPASLTHHQQYLKEKTKRMVMQRAKQKHLWHFIYLAVSSVRAPKSQCYCTSSPLLRFGGF